MKKLLLAISFLFIASILYAEGWRPGEMQINIPVHNKAEIDQIASLKINFDIPGPAFDHLIAYVIPKELEAIDAMGFDYEIEIVDINKHYENFWLTEDSYHSYAEIIALADSLETHFPSICKKYIFGTSLGGRQLAALKISDNVETDEPEAEVMFDGGIHGDEIGAAENVIRFARDLCVNYDADPDIAYLIDNREIWLYLMVNPDGRVNMVRYNNNGVDLNRDWMYMWNGEGSSTGPCSQVESKALRSCMYGNQFVVHTTYHSGTEYISLPWSYRPSSPPDWDHIYQLGGVYSNTSGYANIAYGQGNSGMYPINGSTKDSNYGALGSISWSMEISYSKQPPASQIMQYYNWNYPSMIAMIEYSGYGLEGIVTDATTGDPVTAVVFVNDYLPTWTDPTAGDYHKYVLPGTYTIKIVANGYETQTINNVVVSANNATATNFELTPAESHYVYRFTASQIPGNNDSDEGNTKAVIGAPDEINYSIGKNGWVVLDMQTPVVDGPGPDFIVHEGDSSPESYTFFASETMDGPWLSMGDGEGTTEFDLANSGLVEAQFVKLMDDGDGQAIADNAGFDLDAIEVLPPVSGVYLALYDYTIDDSEGNNNGRIDPGETVDVIVTLRNNGDIVAQNIDGTATTSSPYIDITNTIVNFGNLSQGQMEEGIYTIEVAEGAPLGESFLMNLGVSANSGSYTNSFSMGFTIGLILEDWETGDMSQFEWETSGSADWDISNESPYEGTYCIKSGSIGDEQTTELSISYTVINDGEISFYRKVSSESNYDYLNFYIDNSLMGEWSGDVAWDQVTYGVSAGAHSFRWEYSKDYSVSNGTDCAWVDYIILPAGAVQGVLASFNANQTNICENDMVSFNDNSAGSITSWEWTFEGGYPSTSSEQNPEIVYYDHGTFEVSLTVSDGSSTNTLTLPDYINVLTDPEVPAIPDGPSGALSLPNETSTFTISAISGALNYGWEINPSGAGTLSENGIECIVDWTDYWTGDAEITVKAINNCGESEYSDPKIVNVVITDITENENLIFNVSPNPGNGEFTVQFNQKLTTEANLQVLNLFGEEVKSIENIVSSTEQINLNLDETPGVYILVIQTENKIYKQKFIIK
jgi:PKD repeat protein